MSTANDHVTFIAEQLEPHCRPDSVTEERRAIADERNKALPLTDTKKMLQKFLPLVKIIVAKMKDKLPSHADLEELESVGIVGLINAVDRFDPGKGYTFETYATIRIRGAILDELRNMDMIPRSVRTKQRKLQKTIETLEQRLGREPTDVEIMDELGLEPQKYRKMRSQVKPLNLIFLDGQSRDVENTLHEAIGERDQSVCSEELERRELQEMVARKIMDLPDTQKKVLALYFFEELRLAEIGKIMGVTEARVSQIRSQALDHLRTFVRRMTY